MKRFLPVVLAFMLIFAFSANTFATDVDQVITDVVDTVDYVALSKIMNGVTLNNGIATCSYLVTLQPGYKADVTTVLQKYDGSAWDEVTHWSHSKVSSLNTKKTRAVTSGYSYRAKTYANVYDGSGNFIEQALLISDPVK